MKESSTIIYQRIDKNNPKLPESISKDITAFLNTRGGTIYVGVNENETIEGLADADKVIEEIRSLIQKKITPDALTHIAIEKNTFEGKDIAVIKVSKGTEAPYYIRKFGPNSRGVYVREGIRTVPTDEYRIREMFFESMYGYWEDSPCHIDNLDFTELRNHLRLRGLTLDEKELKTDSGLYTNLALLLSDDSPYSIKIRELADTAGIDMISGTEVTGSVITMCKYVMEELENIYVNGYSFRDPERAVREMVLNSIIHRDYSFSAGNMISIYPDKLTVTSCGSLVPPVTVETIRDGFTAERNPRLVSFFRKLGLVESYGVGISIIEHEAKENMMSVEYRNEEHLFSITLNRRESIRLTPPSSFYDIKPDYHNVILYDGHSPQERTEQDDLDEIYSFIVINQVATRREIEEMLDIRTTKAYSLLSTLVEKGMIVQEKKGRSSYYHLP